MRLILPGNCRNSPKAQLVIAFNEAFLNGNFSSLLDMVEEDIIWDMVGDKIVTGKMSFERMTKTLKDSPLASMELYNIITHGKTAAANGLFIDSEGNRFEFCDVYEFKSAGSKKIQKIKSYVLTAL